MYAAGEEVEPESGDKPIVSRHPTNLDATEFGNLSRADLMSRVRSRGNKTTEGRMVTLLRSSCLSGWRRGVKILGRPDFAWPKRRVVLFVDGCFWHGHDCGRNLTPKNNADHWEKKISATRLRDMANGQALRERGWVVVRVWECELKRDPDVCVQRIRAALNQALTE